MRTIEPHSRLGSSTEFADWLREHCVDPTATYRVEIQGEQMIVYQFHKPEGTGAHIRARCPWIKYENADRLLMSDAEGGPCYLAPFAVKIKSPVPEMIEQSLRFAR